MLICPWTKLVWLRSQLQIAPSTEDITRIDVWLNQKFEALRMHNDYKEYALSLLANALWMIWKDRNSSVFNHQTPNPHLAIKHAVGITKEVMDCHL